MNIYKTSLGAALMLASAQTANAENASAPTTLIGMDAMTSFFTCATKAMSDVSGRAVTLENPAVNIESELEHSRMKVEVSDAKSKNEILEYMSAEWKLDADAAPVATFDASGTLTTRVMIVEFIDGDILQTYADATAKGSRAAVPHMGRNENSNSMLRLDVGTKAEDLVNAVRKCALTPGM